MQGSRGYFSKFISYNHILCFFMRNSTIPVAIEHSM